MMTIAELISWLEVRYAALPEKRRSRVIPHVRSLYEAFGSFADRDFDKCLQADDASFQQRYWEMFLAQHLRQAGHKIDRKKSGPDFWFESDGRKVWIEAVAAERGTGGEIDAFYSTELANRGGWFRGDIFHLRWTQAIRDKVNKYAHYLKNGKVAPDEVCVIAVNSALLGSLGMVGKSDYPALIEVVFGAGPEYVSIDRATMEVVDSGYRREPVIKKSDNIDVAKQFFLEPDTRHISAILASSIGPEMWSPMIAVYNPLASNCLPRGRLGAEFEYYAEDCGDHYEVKTARPSIDRNLGD
jgi:hypothetical protein